VIDRHRRRLCYNARTATFRVTAVADAASQARPIALVVEDDAQIGQLVKFIVEREGYEVVLAQDGRAVQQLLAGMAAPAVIILDVMLPFVDGFQLIAEIRAHAQWKNCPAIMLSAKSQESDIARAMAAGASDFLSKPFLPDDLRQRLRRVLGATGNATDIATDGAADA
jgi:two-component system alkaline phosphatase synthesis response regulator PhoP